MNKKMSYLLKLLNLGGRERKQTALYGSPLLYTITCKLTPKFVPVFFNKMSETLESLQTNYLMESKNDDSS